jgi:hypothetical protein
LKIGILEIRSSSQNSVLTCTINLGTIISTVVLVPTDPLKSFGDLYEIRSQANEIFVNAATVNDVEVIDALTSSQLRTASNSGVV